MTKRVHALLVAVGNGEIAGRDLDLVVAQMFAQQEGIQRGHGIQQPQHRQVALQGVAAVIARLAQASV